MRSKVIYIATMTLFILAVSTVLFARIIDFKIIDIDGVSRYSEDRIAFQHIEIEPKPYIVDKADNSIASLLIIKAKKVYLLKDGYDNPEEVKMNLHIIETENKLIPDVWTNKIDDNPDYIRVTERRIELLKNVNQDFVSKGFKDKYIKWRDEFIKRHVEIFRSIMLNRKESSLIVERKLIPKKVYDQGPAKYSISVAGKSIDEKLYFAEDSDGDGLTETFTVSLPDGFNWGYESGPNVLLIYKCRYKDESSADKNTTIKNLIGNLTHDAYYGTDLEKKIIERKFFKDAEIIDMIDDLYQIDPEFKNIMEDHSTEK